MASSIAAKIERAAKRIGDAIRSVTGAASGGEGLADSGPVGYASGGRVRGPGTLRSDSILAQLSNGEYVIPAHAVRHFGLRFFENTWRLRDPLLAFANGGLADAFAIGAPSLQLASIGASAGGGGMRQPVNIHFGGESFPATMDSDVVSRLEGHATRQAVRSAGRKPLWFQG